MKEVKNMKDTKISLIVCYDSEFGIGKENKIPWRMIEDLKFFAKVTEKSCVLMGRNTWESLPNGGLKDRIHFILSKSLTHQKLDTQNKSGSICYLCKSAEQAIEIYNVYPRHQMFVIGGSEIYRQFLKEYPHLIENIYITQIKENFNCDVFFPKNDLDHFLQTHRTITETLKSQDIDKLSGKVVDYVITKYSVLHLNLYEQFLNATDDGMTEYKVSDARIIHLNRNETGYLNLLKRILDEDKQGRETRNGKTFSVFGPELEFDLTNDTLPLLTTRKMFLRGIFEELIFFIRGETNTKLLEEKGVNIWKGNTSKEFLKARGLDYEEGDMGPMYGFQWRHFGADYNGGHFGAQYKSCEKGHDQLVNLIKGLVEDPHSRRHLLTTYNPAVVEQSVLAPCHGIVVQMYVDGECLDCKMYQRSCDTVLGEPFNITSYALMTHLIAWVCGLKARKLYISLGDAHIYEQHLEGVKEQLKRDPFEFPKLKIKKEWLNDDGAKVEDRIRFLEEMKFEDLEVVGYKSHPVIKFDMIA